MKLLGPDAAEAFRKVAYWVMTFLCKEHPDLGRDGAVCPFVAGATQKDTLWFTFVDTRGLSEADVTALVGDYKGVFTQLKPKQQADQEYASLLIVFPYLAIKDAPRYVDGVKKALKNGLVEEGLMIGEFHRNNKTPGAHNPNFFPNRSPVPLLAIRHMVRSDWRFLTDKPEWIHSWLANQVHDLGARELIKEITELVYALAEKEKVRSRTEKTAP